MKKKETEKYGKKNSEAENTDSENDSKKESEVDSIENYTENGQKIKKKKRKKSDDKSIIDQNEVNLIRTEDIDAQVRLEDQKNKKYKN